VSLNSQPIEYGSSGAPFFDNNHRVIGQLFGSFDLDFCSSNNKLMVVFFGKLEKS